MVSSRLTKATLLPAASFHADEPASYDTSEAMSRRRLPAWPGCLPQSRPVMIVMRQMILAEVTTPTGNGRWRQPMATQASLASLAVGQASAWYHNGWIIGIIAALASGVLIAAVTPLLLRRRKASDLAFSRERAADDLLTALRLSVAAGTLPPAPVVQATARACAYRRGLDPRHAVSTLTLLDVLVSEIMRSAFLDSEARSSLAKSVLSLRAELDGGLVSRPSPDSGDNYRTETIFASALGAASIGGAAAVSAASGNWIPITIVGALGILSLAAMQLSGRAARPRSGTAGSAFDADPEGPEVVPLESLLRGPDERSR